MDEEKRELLKEYEAGSKKTRRLILGCVLAGLGLALIVTAFLFRTQYPLKLQNRGMVHYVYSHILLRDETNYNYFNRVTGHEVRYYIVYRNGSVYYEQETNFAVYSAHAAKENAQPGITNHAAIKESVDKYTFLDKFGNTYCYDTPTSVFKALFDASYAGGKIYLRFAAYFASLISIAAGVAVIKKAGGKHEKTQ